MSRDIWVYPNVRVPMVFIVFSRDSWGFPMTGYVGLRNDPLNFDYNLNLAMVWSSTHAAMQVADGLNIMSSQPPLCRVKELRKGETAGNQSARWTKIAKVLRGDLDVGLCFVYRPRDANRVLEPEEACRIVNDVGRSVRTAFRSLQDLKEGYHKPKSGR